MRMGSFVVPFLTLYLTGQRGLKVEEAALVVSVLGIGNLGSGLFGGVLTDYMGRRFTLLVCLFVAPITLVALGMMQFYAGIVIMAGIFGFFSDLYRPASAAMVADLVEPADRVRAYALLYWGINLGAAIAPLLAGYFATRNYMLLFVGDAITTALFGVLIWQRVPDTTPLKNMNDSSPTFLQQFSYVRRDVYLWAFFALTLCFASLHVQGSVTLPLEMKSEGLSEEAFGMALATNGLLVVVLVLPLNTILPYIPRFYVLAIAAVFSAVGFGMNRFVHTEFGFVFAVLIWTTGEILAAPIASAIAADLAPLSLRGIYQGVFRSSWGLAATIGPLGGGFIFSHWGGDTLWNLMFILGLSTSVAYLLIAKPMLKQIEQRQFAS